MSRFARGPRRRPLASLSSRDIDRMRETWDREMEFRENSGDREDEFERRQGAWLVPFDDDDEAA